MKKEILLLILSALTSVVLFKFDFQNGFEYVNTKLNYSVIDFAGKSSNENFITTQILSYLIFSSFLISIKKDIIDRFKISFYAFLILLCIGIYIETIAIYEKIMGGFEGRYCRNGNLLTIIGIVFLISIRRLRKQN